MSFIIFSLPRSRTFWLSRFLSYGGWHCSHDSLVNIRSLDDIRSQAAIPMHGTAETGAAPWWRIIRDVAPSAKVVTIRRPVGEVIESLVALGFDRDISAGAMRRLDAKLDQIERRIPDVISVRFDDLATEEACARVFEHCLPFRHDHAWWAKLAPVNLQQDIHFQMRHFRAVSAQMEKLSATLKHHMLSQMVREPAERDGMTFQEEPLDAVFKDCESLRREHCVSVGEHPDQWKRKDWKTFRFLEEKGWLQTMSARCNGRVFGYLVTILGPSLENEGETTAVHTAFYASPDAPGTGRKLMQAATARLKDRGINELFLRAGPRGDGPRMAAVYRRMGASEDGQMFRMRLN